MSKYLHSGSLFGLLVALLALAGSPAVGAADIGFRGVGAQVGAILPSDWDTGYEVGLHADIGEITPGLFLQPSLIYWEASDTETIRYTVGGMEFEEDIDSDLSNLALGADVLWYFSGERRGWYVGGGLYLNRIEVDDIGGKSTHNRVGGNAIGGYDFNIGNTSAFVEGRYHVVSGLNTVQLGIGFRFGN